MKDCNLINSFRNGKNNLQEKEKNPAKKTTADSTRAYERKNRTVTARQFFLLPSIRFSNADDYKSAPERNKYLWKLNVTTRSILPDQTVLPIVIETDQALK